MIEIFGHSISFVEMVLSILILLFFITQGSWWIGRIFGKYLFFPSHGICMAVHRNINRWFEKTTKVISSLETPNVNGFISTVLLVGIISLNVTLLAQIWELFLPPGKRIAFPLIGTYATFPLIVGLLYALVQVALSSVRKVKKTGGEKTLGITLLLVASIIVEAGLNFYRAWLLTSGGQQISPTLWDQVIIFGGPILAGFLGFLVPTTEIVLSPYAMREFIEPVIKDVAIIVRFLASIMSLALAWIYFGFHYPKPIELPGPINRIKSEIEELEKEESRIRRKLEELKQLVRELKSPPIGATQLDALFADIERNIELLESEIEDNINKSHEWISNINDRSSLNDAMDYIWEWVLSKRADVEPINSQTQDICDAVDTLPRDYETWLEHSNSHLDDVKDAKSDTVALKKRLIIDSPVRSVHADIEKVLEGKGDSCNKLSKEEIDELVEAIFSKNDDRHEKEWNRLVLAKSRSILDDASDEFSRIDNSLDNYSLTLHTLQEQIETKKHGLEPLRPETELEKVQKGLLGLDKRVTDRRVKTNNRIKKWRGLMRSKALEHKAVMEYVILLISWRPRI